MTRDFLTISNLLSLSRIALALAFAVVMVTDVPSAELWGLGLLVLAMVTDKLDGDLARWLGQETTWGRILDPLADKIGVGVVSVVLVVRGLVPLWFVVFLVVRDLLILSGGILLRVRHGVVLPSNRTGKWTVGVIAAALILGLLEAQEGIQLAVQVLATAMGVVSLVLYGRAFERQRSAEGTGS